MSKLKTLAVSGALLASLGLSTGALMTAYMNRPPPQPRTEVKPADLAQVAGAKPDAAKGDRVVALDPVNAPFTWTCGKASRSGARAEDHHGRWTHLAGAVAYNAKAKRVLGLEVTFATDSLTSDNDILTRTVLAGQQWFTSDKATFAAGECVARSADNEKGVAADKSVKDWTHLLKGKFTLNGVTKDLAVPARIAFDGESARIEAQFPISRAAFDVQAHKTDLLAGAGAAMFVVDDEVLVSAKIAASPDLATLVAELGNQVQAQQLQIKAMNEAQANAGKELTNRLIKLESALEDAKAELKKAQAAGPAAAPAQVDLASLPKSFEDAVVLPPEEKDYIAKETDPATREVKDVKRHFSYPGMKAPFKMILVPGDPAKGIAPFYIGETEVTWDMFKPWSHWYDKTPIDAEKECKEQGIRPSNADSYGDTSHNDKHYDGFPALGMSRKNAEAFCALLSKQTGRTYRLPTEAEWELAYALGGGDPASEEEKKAVAWGKENAAQTPESFQNGPAPVKTKKPDKLGLYDMLGNVSEWVKTPGAADADGRNTFVRGGNYLTPLAELSGKHRMESDSRRNVEGSWNASYPNDPVSKWWFKDCGTVGFRLVCEPANLPKK